MHLSMHRCAACGVSCTVASCEEYVRIAGVCAEEAGSSSRKASSASLEQAVSLLQHHDAITGTEKQHVANDYHWRLGKGVLVLYK